MLAIISMACQNAIAATQEAIIEAFKRDKAVQAEIQKVKERTGVSQEEIQVVGLGGLCGVAGCSFRYLVVMGLRRGGVNSESGSVLATVTGHNGIIGKVTLVELKPKNLPEPKAETKFPSPELEIKIERKLPPLPTPPLEKAE